MNTSEIIKSLKVCTDPTGRCRDCIMHCDLVEGEIRRCYDELMLLAAKHLEIDERIIELTRRTFGIDREKSE